MTGKGYFRRIKARQGVKGKMGRGGSRGWGRDGGNR